MCPSVTAYAILMLMERYCNKTVRCDGDKNHVRTRYYRPSIYNTTIHNALQQFVLISKIDSKGHRESSHVGSFFHTVYTQKLLCVGPDRVGVALELIKVRRRLKHAFYLAPIHKATEPVPLQL